MSEPYQVNPKILVYLQETAPSLAQALTMERMHTCNIILGIEAQNAALLEACEAGLLIVHAMSIGNGLTENGAHVMATIGAQMKAAIARAKGTP